MWWWISIGIIAAACFLLAICVNKSEPDPRDPDMVKHLREKEGEKKR